MVYIYRKQVNGKDYYYLRASVRNGTTVVTKDIAYLGTDPKLLSEKIDHIPQAYKDKIRKSYKTLKRFIEANHYLSLLRKEKHKKDPYLDKRLLLDVEATKKHWTGRFLKQDELTQQEILKAFIIEFAHNTTSLEGNTITLKEAADLLLEARTPKDRTLREVYDVRNTERVFTDLFTRKPAITHKLIQDVHAALLEGIDQRTSYRTQDIRVYRSQFDTTPASYVAGDMTTLLNWLKEAKSLHPVARAIIFHHRLEKIHPFMDGNGRTGRMLMNLLLLRDGYPPLLFRKKDRPRYLAALRTADRSATPDGYAPLLQLAGESVRRYWDLFLF